MIVRLEAFPTESVRSRAIWFTSLTTGFYFETSRIHLLEILVVQWEGYILKDIVDLVNNQNPLSKKIQDTDINRLNSSIINRNKYYYSNNLEHDNEKPVSLRDLSNTNSTITSEASHFGFKNGGELII